jgi:hypothetical protein
MWQDQRQQNKVMSYQQQLDCLKHLVDQIGKSQSFAELSTADRAASDVESSLLKADSSNLLGKDGRKRLLELVESHESALEANIPRFQSETPSGCSTQ